MKELKIIRHGISEGNIKKIIQGTSGDYALSKAGIMETQSFAEKNYGNLKGVDTIVSSPTQRAKETAKIIAEKYNLSIELDENLIEFNPGILEGISHEEAKVNHPNEYAVWLKRGDLDNIPKAEKGDELQARALAFLEKYHEKKEYNELVVSHAGFMRALINTAQGEERTKPIDISHNKIHTINNPWDKIIHERLEGAKTSKVYRVRTKNKDYIMKIKKEIKKQNPSLKDIINSIRDKDNITPRLLYEIYRDESKIKILDYMSGNHIFGELSKNQTERLVKTVYKVHKRLSNVDGKKIGGLTELLQRYQNLLKKESYVKNIGEQLLNDNKIKEMMSKKQVCVHYDLHRSNVLFEKDNVHLIDLDGIVKAPPEFQLGSLAMSSFMLDNPRSFNLENITPYWGEKYNPKEVYLMMLARSFIGSAFFQYRKENNSLNKEEKDILDRYNESNEIILQNISNY